MQLSVQPNLLKSRPLICSNSILSSLNSLFTHRMYRFDCDLQLKVILDTLHMFKRSLGCDAPMLFLLIRHLQLLNIVVENQTIISV